MPRTKHVSIKPQNLLLLKKNIILHLGVRHSCFWYISRLYKDTNYLTGKIVHL